MAWDSGWNDIFSEHEWGRYPAEELVRFIGRRYRRRDDRKDTVILEVGCGTGANVWYLAREGFSVYGIDGSRVAVERAGKRLSEEGLAACLDTGDAMHLPYDDASFDGALDVECIYANDMNDSAAIIDEIHRVLKPGGWFFSKTFMTGTSGDGSGTLLDGEQHTFIELTEGPLKSGYGIIRFTSRDDIDILYSSFDIESIDSVVRTDKNGMYELREWVIVSRKSSAHKG